MSRIAPGLRLTACCFALLLAANARAQLEGTLFTEPEEREYLDFLREEFLRNNAAADFNIEEADIPDIPQAVAAAEEAGPIEYSFGGAMARRDGVRIWLNGNLLAASELPDGFSLLESGNTMSLRIVHEGKTFLLLPGQTVDVTAGTVVENFQRPAPAAEAAAVTAAAPSTAEAPAATGELTPETAAPAANAAPPVSAGALAAEGAVPESEASVDPIAAAVDGLDEEEVDSLFELLENRRLARTQTEGTVDEAPDNEAP